MLYIIRYGEIGLKGLNRGFFEKKLADNIGAAISRKTKDYRIKRKQGRIIVETDEQVSEELKRVFGIVNFSQAERADSYEGLKNLALRILKTKNFLTFRVTATRANKNFKKTSGEVAAEMGELILNDLNKKVSLKNFDINAQIEISDKFYIFFEKTPCQGGLPVGAEGKALCLIESDEGLAAAFLMMKRGCEISCAGFREFDISKLSLFSPSEINFAKISSFEEIEDIIKSEKAKVLAVQDNLENIKDYKTSAFIARPLIALEKNEIEDILNRMR